MIRLIARVIVLVASPCLVAVATHLPTADYFSGYAGTRSVSPEAAARSLTWAETDISTSPRLRALGIKTILYTDPNRTMVGDADFTPDDSAYAHDCYGRRIMANRPGQFLMDPHSPVVRTVWRSHVTRYAAEGHFDAILNDDANNLLYAHGQPCNYQPMDWLQATNDLQQSLNYPVIYNALSTFTDRTVAMSIGLNRTAIGGMMEQCYAASPSQPRESGDSWYVAEATEIKMAQDHRFFFCYGNDTTNASLAIDSRLYVLASFLLTYNPSTSVLWEYYEGPSRFHVMPETGLVLLQPAQVIRSVSDLLRPSGVYERDYSECYLGGRGQGPCIVAVNPDAVSHKLALNRQYRRTLTLFGGGVADGGTARILPPGPPAELAPLSATIAFE